MQYANATVVIQLISQTFLRLTIYATMKMTKQPGPGGKSITPPQKKTKKQQQQNNNNNQTTKLNKKPRKNP